MELIIAWWGVVSQLKSAFKRKRTFYWAVIIIMGFCVRGDRFGGVSSFVRGLGLVPKCYQPLLHVFHSSATCLEKLTQCWVTVVLQVCAAYILYVNGKPVLFIDGIAIPKEGTKMPGVQSLHQSSDNNSKAEFIMGHFFQCIGILVGSPLGTLFSIPLVGRIHLGTKTTNRDKRTLFDKAIEMLTSCFGEKGFYLVGDAYYGAGKMITGVRKMGGELLVKVRSNAVAYFPAAAEEAIRRGRKKIYGAKVKLKNFFKDLSKFNIQKVRLYGEDVEVWIRSEVLLSRRFGGIPLLYIFIIHPTRGKMILLSTDLKLKPVDALRMYSYRFKIEVGFKAAVHSVGAFLYRFWMKNMEETRRKQGTKHLHKKTEDYRKRYFQKHRAYELFVQFAFIAQGILQYLALAKSKAVLKYFRTWFRTIRPNVLPSEAMVSISLKNALPDFIGGSVFPSTLKKFIHEKTTFDEQEDIALTG